MSGATLDDVLLLSVFARVVETKSFTAAAAALSISKATVSQRIVALEKRCGTRLLHRTTRRMVLTEEGVRLYEECLGINMAADAAVPGMGRMSHAPEGRLRVTTPVGYGVGQLNSALPSFAARYPRVTVDLVLTDRVVDLIAEGIDVAVRVAEKLSQPAYGRRKLGTECTVVCGAPDYFAIKGVPEVPHDLRHHACLKLATATDEWSFRLNGDRVVVPVSGPLSCDNILALRSAIVLGLGLGMLPRSIVVEDLERGVLRTVLDDFTTPLKGVWALLPDPRHVPPKARVFVDHLAATSRQKIAIAP
jgi:DNA-binding transcriptional LysR family regulator